MGSPIITAYTIAGLRQQPTNVPIAFCLGSSAIGDGGGGIFLWNPTSTATDDGVTVVAPSGYTTGRWVRSDAFSGLGFLAAYGADVASAAAIVPTGSVFHVTGTTNITSITATGLSSGTEITIIFDGILTFTAGNNLKIAGNFVTTASDCISLVLDAAGNWYEIGRSVNA